MSPMYKPNGMMPGKMPKMPKMPAMPKTPGMMAEVDAGMGMPPLVDRVKMMKSRGPRNTGLASRLMDSDKWRLLKMRYCRS